MRSDSKLVRRALLVCYLTLGLLYARLYGWQSSLAPLSEETLGRDAIMHFRAGQEAMRSGKLQRAVAEFQKVLHLDSGLLEARVNLGVAYQMLGQYDLAVVELSKAMGEKPNLGPNIILGMDYLKLGSPAKALGPLQEALTIEPSNREAHRAVAACYWVQDKYKEASKEFLSVFSLEPDTERAWSDLGRDYLAMARRLAGRMADKYQSSPWALDFLSVGFSVRDEPTVNQRMIDRGLCERLVQQWEGEVLS